MPNLQTPAFQFFKPLAVRARPLESFSSHAYEAKSPPGRWQIANQSLVYPERLFKCRIWGHLTDVESMPSHNKPSVEVVKPMSVSNARMYQV